MTIQTRGGKKKETVLTKHSQDGQNRKMKIKKHSGHKNP